HTVTLSTSTTLHLPLIHEITVIIFFLLSDIIRYLHSFPTRRSSDLAASWGDASTVLTSAHSGSSLGVTFCHDFPPSRVTCTRPSSLPTQITLESFELGATVKIVL